MHLLIFRSIFHRHTQPHKYTAVMNICIYVCCECCLPVKPFFLPNCGASVHPHSVTIVLICYTERRNLFGHRLRDRGNYTTGISVLVHSPSITPCSSTPSLSSSSSCSSSIPVGADSVVDALEDCREPLERRLALGERPASPCRWRPGQQGGGVLMLCMVVVV